MHRRFTTCLLLLFSGRAALPQAGVPPADKSGTAGPSKLVGAVFDYLQMAGTQTASDFRPLTQRERNGQYFKSLVNPVLYFRGALSGAIDHKNDKPQEWGQGASGYFTRTGNILAQYGIQRTVTFGLSSAIHEDNRYFGSGRKGFWRRTGYAVAGSFLARRDNGKRYPSVSLIGGFAAAAFVSRAWQPPSTRSAGDGAVSFGYSMGYNTLAAVVKEFLPDIARPFLKHRKTQTP